MEFCETAKFNALFCLIFVINSLNKYSSLFKTVLILLQRFLLPSLQYEMNGEN